MNKRRTASPPAPDRIRRKRRKPEVIYTIGHSTQALEQFIALLRAHSINQVADVRTVPRSRHNPQFNGDTLPRALERAGIEYTHLPKLGGLRHARRDSPNAGWRNASFRGFADYMQTPDFVEGLSELLTMATAQRTAIMCAESLPWRCHRSLIADALSLRGVEVRHITGPAVPHVHTLTPFARVKGTQIAYPPEQQSLSL